MDDDECGVWGCMDEHEFTLYQVWKWKWEMGKSKILYGKNRWYM